MRIQIALSCLSLVNIVMANRAALSLLAVTVVACWGQMPSVQAQLFKLDFPLIDIVKHSGNLLQKVTDHVDGVISGHVDRLLRRYGLKELEKCYDSSVGKSDLHIFRHNVDHIIKGVLVS